MYRVLNPNKVLDTIETLGRRIEERFPAQGLSKVCRELSALAKESKEKSEWISRPRFGLRVLVAVIVSLSLFALFYSISVMDIKLRSFDIGELVQITEAGLNNIVLIGAALFFLLLSSFE